MNPTTAIEMAAIAEAQLKYPEAMIIVVTCPGCNGKGDECMAGCSAHPSNWYPCDTCKGKGVMMEIHHTPGSFELAALTYTPTSTEGVAEALGQVHCTGHVDYAPAARALLTCKFVVGDKVRKVTGEYRINGEVRAVFTKADGTVRLVVEHNAEGGGSFLHIYSEANLEMIP